MKLGILTFHSVINYGSALQAYAMQEGIRMFGVEAELIDYRPGMSSIHRRIINNWKRLLSFQKWKQYLGKKIISKRNYYKNPERASRRTKKFIEFQKNNFRMSPLIQKRDDLWDLGSRYDACICGSDQIWNPTYIGHDLSYYLDFMPNDKRIAYAPSIAVADFPAEYKAEIQKQLNCYHRISVREKESIEMIKRLTGKTAEVVVDPTLLLDKDSWIRIEKAPRKDYTEFPYIFCYFLGPNPEYCDYVTRLKNITGFCIVLVTCTELKVFRNFGDIICEDIGPAEFLYLIHHAEYICTDSFHGTVFSIINEKKFFTFKRYKDKNKSSENSRIYTLLHMIGYSSRLISQIEDIDELYERELDYEQINIKISEKREQSKRFLTEEMERIKSYK